MSVQNFTKKPSINASDLKPKYRKENFTLKKVLTADETKLYYISFLKEMSANKGPWREYLDFYLANQSGEVDSMKPETRKYCDKMIKDIHDKYSEVKS